MAPPVACSRKLWEGKPTRAQQTLLRAAERLLEWGEVPAGTATPQAATMSGRATASMAPDDPGGSDTVQRNGLHLYREDCIRQELAHDCIGMHETLVKMYPAQGKGARVTLSLAGLPREQR